MLFRVTAKNVGDVFFATQCTSCHMDVTKIMAKLTKHVFKIVVIIGVYMNSIMLLLT